MTAPATIFVAHDAPIRDAQFLPGGAQILTGAVDGEMKLWRFAEPDLLGAALPVCEQTFDHYNGNYRGVRITADGRLAIILGANWTQIWSLRLGGWFSDLTDQDEEFMVLAKNENLMVTEANWVHGGLRVWDLQRGRPVAVLKAPREKISPRYHPAMEDMNEGEIDAATPMGLITNVSVINDKLLAVSTENHQTMLFDLDRLVLERQIPNSIALIHDDCHTAFSSGSSSTRVAFDLFDDSIAKVKMEDAADIYGHGKVACLGDGRVITTSETTISVWRPGDWTCCLTIPDAHAVPPSENPTYASINHLVVLPDGVHFATATPCAHPKVWNSDTGLEVAMAPTADVERRHGTGRLRLHPLGLLGEVSNTVHLWDPYSGDAIWVSPALHSLLDVAADGRIACGHQNRLAIFTPGLGG
jgi:WD40 repeat protein